MSWGVCSGRDIETYTVSPANSPLLHHPTFSVSNPPPPPHHHTKPFHTTTSNPPPSPQPHIPPILSPSPSKKKFPRKTFSAQNVLRTRRAYLLYRGFDCISPAVLKICRSKSNDQKTASQPIKTEALTIDKLERHHYNFQEEARKPQPRAMNP